MIEDEDILMKLLEEPDKCGLDQSDVDSETPLMHFIRMNLTVASKILETPNLCNINKCDYIDYTKCNALSYAAERGYGDLCIKIVRCDEFSLSNVNTKYFERISYHLDNEMFHVFKEIFKKYDTFKDVFVIKEIDFKFPDAAFDIIYDVLNEKDQIDFLINQNKYDKIEKILSFGGGMSIKEAMENISEYEKMNREKTVLFECFACGTETRSCYIWSSCSHIKYICDSCIVVYPEKEKCPMCRCTSNLKKGYFI